MAETKAKPKVARPRALAVGIGAPAEVMAAARARGVLLPDVYYGQLQGLARSLAFSVAGIASVDQLEAIKRSLDDSLADGSGFREWKRRALAGEIPGLFELPPHRLENIYRTNLQTVYSRGNGEAIKRNARTHPYLLYSAVNDSRTRPAHAAMGGTIRRIDDPWWLTRKPPNGYQCRCRAIALTEAEAKRRGITERPTTEAPDPGWDYDPWADPKAGAKRALERRRRTASAVSRDALDKIERGAELAGADDPDSWVQIGPQRGSNPGGQYQAPDGRRFYLKFYADPDQARAEVAAFGVYRALGVDTLEARIVERAAPDGQRRLAIATAWREDLARLDPSDAPRFAGDLARIYHGSVLTANWDVAGLDLDNLAVSQAGRVVVLDAGGSFTFRAQGAPKRFDGAEAPELGSLRDPLVNRSAAAVFNPALDADVWAERDQAAAGLAGLTDGAVAGALESANVSPALAASWGAAIRGRRELLRDRYNLDGMHSPAAPGFAAIEGEVLDLFEDSRGRLVTDAAYPGGHRYSSQLQPATLEAVPRFEAYVRQRFEGLGFTRTNGQRVGPVELLRWAMTQWSGSSSSEGGALLKAWAASRFGRQGAAISFHYGHSGADALAKVEEVLTRWERLTNIKRADVFELFDAEYAFNQALLRRGYGWGPLRLHRYMSEGEYRASARGDAWNGNAVASYTQSVGAFSGDRLVSFEARIEAVLKIWQQGPEYMLFEEREAEFVGIGTRWRIVPGN